MTFSPPLQMFDSVFGPEDQHNWGGGFLIAQARK